MTMITLRVENTAIPMNTSTPMSIPTMVWPTPMRTPTNIPIPTSILMTTTTSTRTGVPMTIPIRPRRSCYH